jgi:peroxiredoxin Q/BCP
MASVSSIEDNTAFAENHHAGFPILSDPDKKMSEAYGVLHKSGLTNRWTYYIDTQGILVKVDKDVKPQTAGADLTGIMEELGFPKK